MTEGSFDDGNCLVRVRAQVMTRDDSTGGWVPMGGGGLSHVSVSKRAIPNEDDTKHEYLIYGKRISDQSVILSCTIKKDFQYNKVMPTFHHWLTGDKRFGLTFQTAADARAFDKGVRMAVEDLLDGTGESTHVYVADVGDDDVFMTIDLPMESQSSSGSSSGSGSGLGRPSSTTPNVPGGDPYLMPSQPYSHANHPYLHRINFFRPLPRTAPGTNGGGNNNNGATTTHGGNNGGSGGDLQPIVHCEESIWMKDRSLGSRDPKKQLSLVDNDKIEIMPGESYSYVQFAKDKIPRTEHEYSYPTVRRDSIDSLKKPHQMQVISSQPPLLPVKNKKKKDNKKEGQKLSPLTRVRCRHCLDMYSEEDNRRGSCEYAPDRVLACINGATCISCAQCMLYHCMSDAEGDFNHHPCSCNSSDEHCRGRWAGLALLSIFVPCLWCYLPLRACHNCGTRCGVCGGRHEAA